MIANRDPLKMDCGKLPHFSWGGWFPIVFTIVFSSAYLCLAVRSPFLSNILVREQIAVFPGFPEVSRKKDPWKEWGRYP